MSTDIGMPSTDVAPLARDFASDAPGVRWRDPKWALGGACVIGGLVTIGAYWPAVMSPDSLDQLRQVDAWSFSTSQPPVMSLLWGILSIVAKGPLPMLLLQACAWWGGWWLLIRKTVPARPWLQSGLALIVGFWPPLFAMVGTIWRDVHMTLALLLAVGLLVDVEPRRQRRKTIIAGALVAYASAVRLNAVFSVIPLACWVAWGLFGLERRRSSDARRFVVLAACVVAMVFGGRWMNLALANSVWHPEQCLQVFDLVAISSRTGENLVPPAIRNGAERPEQVASYYTAFTCVSAYSGPMENGIIVRPRLLLTESPETLKQIRTGWWDAIRAHPGDYLRHRFTVFAANMAWNDLPLHYAYERGVPVNDLGLVGNTSRFSGAIYRVFDFTLSRMSWLWRPWVFVWFTLLLLVGCALAGRRGVVPARTLVVLASSLLYTLPYLLVAPAADLRYHHWPIAATFIAAILLAYELRNANGSPSRSVGRRSPAQVGIVVLAVAVATAGLAWAAATSRIDFGPASPHPDRVVIANNRGVELMAAADYERARPLFLEAAAGDPQWWAPEVNLGISAWRLGRPDEAIRHYDRAVSLDRGGVDARGFRAEFLIAQGRAQDAARDLEASRTAGRSDYELYKSIAAVAVTLGDVEAAASASDSCIALDPARFSRDIVAIATPFFGDPDTAARGVAYFERLRERLPNAWWVHANLGALHARLGHTELARRESEAGVKLKGGTL